MYSDTGCEKTIGVNVITGCLASSALIIHGANPMILLREFSAASTLPTPPQLKKRQNGCMKMLCNQGPILRLSTARSCLLFHYLVKENMCFPAMEACRPGASVVLSQVSPRTNLLLCRSLIETSTPSGLEKAVPDSSVNVHAPVAGQTGAPLVAVNDDEVNESVMPAYIGVLSTPSTVTD